MADSCYLEIDAGGRYAKVWAPASKDGPLLRARFRLAEAESGLTIDQLKALRHAKQLQGVPVEIPKSRKLVR